MSDSNNTVIWVIGGLALTYLLLKSTPQAIAQQNAALVSAANLQSQAIDAGETNQEIQTGADLAQSLLNDF